MTLNLKRIATGPGGTFGVLIRDALPIALTLELPWRDNQPDVSCIPAGRYRCSRTVSKKFGETFEVQGVTGRTHILFHRGNVAGDSRGCIVLGGRFGSLRGLPAVLQSGEGFYEFMNALIGRDGFLLSIENHCEEG